MKKKIFALLLASVMTVSVVACGTSAQGGTEESKETNNSAVSADETQENTSEVGSHAIGDTVETDLYRVTLKDAKLTNNILVCNGEKADKATFTKAEEFFTPSDTPFVDEDGYVIEGVHGFSPSKDSGNIYLYYNVEFEYIGKKERTIVNMDFSPVVTYEDYTFDSNHFSFYREKLDTNISTWSNFESDSDAVSTVKALGLEIGYFNGKIQPLSSTVYEIRGIIPVPKTISEDTDATLTLKLCGEDFVIK